MIDRTEDGSIDALIGEVRSAAVQAGAARALLLDVDGTLAPIAPTPDEAVVPQATLAALRRLIDSGWTVVAVSGRPAAQIERMVPLPGLLVFGSHGLERPPGAPALRGAPQPEVLRDLDRLCVEARRLATDHPGVRLERKPAGIALHDRALAGNHLEAWRRAVRAWLAEQDLAGLEVLEGKRVLELRPRGIDKGSVVETIATRLGLRGEDRSFVALGDDVTDEDMFRKIRGLGLGVRVGPPAAATLATRHLPSSLAVGEFLRELAGA